MSDSPVANVAKTFGMETAETCGEFRYDSNGSNGANPVFADRTKTIALALPPPMFILIDPDLSIETISPNLPRASQVWQIGLYLSWYSSCRTPCHDQPW